ncbi:hypothetical protein ACTFQF_14530 [Aliivibrio fischeri]|uniref:hypothetical protein n=1 Tax=Aliivibrio fischeri TaxID=668 RepID=UPI0007C520CE|nr:hypothetical protein [Aliivibrio fischeri]MBP3142298.1 hypothetical protein [Aliivibrio fischeri]MBP3157075.1 hypothetical protein [Aliivibrio fischeri]MCE7572632.1 hypothetical protein [Aliivibrio fischeri]
MAKLKIDLEIENKLLKQELEFNKKEISLLNEIINQINIHKDREIKRNDRLSDFFDEFDEYFKEIQESHDNIYSYLSSMDERHCNTHNDRDKKYVGKINELVQPINQSIKQSCY